MEEEVKYEYIGIETEDIYEVNVDDERLYLYCEDDDEETVSQQNEQIEIEGKFLNFKI